MSYPYDPASPPGPAPAPAPPGYQGQQPGYPPAPAYPAQTAPAAPQGYPAPAPYPGQPGPPGGPGVPGQPGYGGYPGYQMGGSAGAMPISSAGRRFGAYLVDVLLMVVTLFIGWLIWSLVIWSKGQSPGKSLLGMRCVRTDTGRAATWGTMCLRELVGKVILGNATFGITTLVSAFMILGGDRHEGVWDKLAATVVVDDPHGQYLS